MTTKYGSAREKLKEAIEQTYEALFMTFRTEMLFGGFWAAASIHCAFAAFYFTSVILAIVCFLLAVMAGRSFARGYNTHLTYRESKIMSKELLGTVTALDDLLADLKPMFNSNEKPTQQEAPSSQTAEAKPTNLQD